MDVKPKKKKAHTRIVSERMSELHPRLCVRVCLLHLLYLFTICIFSFLLLLLCVIACSIGVRCTRVSITGNRTKLQCEKGEKKVHEGWMSTDDNVPVG